MWLWPPAPRQLPALPPPNRGPAWAGLPCFTPPVALVTLVPPCPAFDRAARLPRALVVLCRPQVLLCGFDTTVIAVDVLKTLLRYGACRRGGRRALGLELGLGLKWPASAWLERGVGRVGWGGGPNGAVAGSCRGCGRAGGQGWFAAGCLCFAAAGGAWRMHGWVQLAGLTGPTAGPAAGPWAGPAASGQVRPSEAQGTRWVGGRAGHDARPGRHLRAGQVGEWVDGWVGARACAQGGGWMVGAR